MKRLAILAVTMFSLAVPASFAQTDTSTRQTTTTTDPATGQQTTTTTTQTKVKTDNDDRWHYNHGSIGVFADYFRLEATDTNHWGVGGRGGFGIHPHVQLEGEIAYDFTQSRSATVTDSLGNIVTARASFRVLHGLFGPKFQTTGPVRLFAVVKGGFVNFKVDTTAITLGNVPRVFNGVTDGDTHFALYPGGGLEAFLGPFGVRGDIGDEIYWRDGARHNLRFSVGPVIRF
jgi:opacity protein-like surface antigen